MSISGMEIWLWFRAVCIHWWTLMSCAIFTAIGFWGAYAYKSNVWFVQSTSVAAALSLFIGCYLAWREKHRMLIAFEMKFLHERPILGIEINSFYGERVWIEHNNPTTIFIKHLSGRIPTSIQFEPIYSKAGRFNLQFAPLPHIDPQNPKPMIFEINEMGQPKLSARDREITHAYEKDMLLLFLADCPERSGEIEYSLIAIFLDRGEPQKQQFKLRWDWNKYGFSRDTT